MTKSEKLKTKFVKGSISARELRTLLQQLGWKLERTRGSHEIWMYKGLTFILATHSKDLKPYQVREIRTLLQYEDENL